MRGRLLWALAVLLLAAGAQGASASVVALQDDRLPTVQGAALEERLDLLASTGVRVTRVDVLWRQVATRRPASPADPSDPAYDWSGYDALFRGLAARGIGVIAGYYSTPAWASASGKPQAAPRAADAGRFAGAIARRYDGTRTDAVGRPLPEIRRIEVWNEPNIAQFWSPQCRRGPRNRYVPIAARNYAALVSVAAREIRRANPDALVLGGVAGPAGGIRDRVRCRTGSESVSAGSMIAALRAENVRIDAWSQHLYPIGSPRTATFFPSWNTLGQLTPLLDKLRPNLPIYVTETGYHTSYNRFHRYFVSEAQQAAWLDETFQVARRTPRVAVTVWFNLQDNPAWTGGLLHGDLSRKPAWDRFTRLARTTPVPAGWAP
jgi:hypothetical protein